MARSTSPRSRSARSSVGSRSISISGWRAWNLFSRGLRQVGRALAGQADAAWLAVEQAGIEVGFQLADMVADRALADQQFLTGATKAQQAADGLEGAQGMQGRQGGRGAHDVFPKRQQGV